MRKRHIAKRNKTLTYRQRRAVVAMMTCPTITQAAAKAGVNVRTIYKWMNKQEFAAAVDAYLGAVERAAYRRLQRLAEEAANVIGEALREGGTADRIRAAKMLFDVILRFHEIISLDERVKALEIRLMEKSNDEYKTKN